MLQNAITFAFFKKKKERERERCKFKKVWMDDGKLLIITLLVVFFLETFKGLKKIYI